MTSDPGFPTWLDLRTSDVPAAQTFYGGLFGWTFGDNGGFPLALRSGEPLCGFIAGERQPYWNVYLRTADLAATLAAVTGHGGEVVAGPFEISGDAARTATVRDPQGGKLSLWEPRGFDGLGSTGEPDSLSHVELMSDDTAAAAAFYSAVFGYHAEVREDGYVMLLQDDRFAAGILPKPDPEIPTGWELYFACEDVDGYAARARDLGGEVLVPPTDTPGGRFAALGDPLGAIFHVMKLRPM